MDKLKEAYQLTDKYLDIINEQGSLTPKRKTFHSVIGMALFTKLKLFEPYRKLKNMIERCNTPCGMFKPNTIKRQHCLVACKVKVKKEEIKNLTSYLDKCNELKDPEKCKERLNKKIIDCKERLKEFEILENKLKLYMVKRGKDASLGDDVNIKDVRWYN